MDIRQTPEWGNYLSKIGWKIAKAGNTQVFIRPVPLISRSFIKIQHPQNPISFSKIDQIAKKHKALLVLIEPVGLNLDPIAFLKNGYRPSNMSQSHTATIQIDLTKKEDEIFKSFSENARRNIKKSQHNNLKVKIVDLKKEKDDLEFRKFYDLLTNLTHLKNFYIPGYGEFHKKMLALKSSSFLLFANLDKKQIAAVWLGMMDNTAFYMNTGILQEGYDLLANYLLVWEAIKFSKKKRCKIFDFEGIYDPRFPKERPSWKNFTQFKMRFHGQVLEHPQPQIKYYSKIFQVFALCNKILSR